MSTCGEAAVTRKKRDPPGGGIQAGHGRECLPKGEIGSRLHSKKYDSTGSVGSDRHLWGKENDRMTDEE